MIALCTRTHSHVHSGSLGKLNEGACQEALCKVSIPQGNPQPWCHAWYTGQPSELLSGFHFKAPFGVISSCFHLSFCLSVSLSLCLSHTHTHTGMIGPVCQSLTQKPRSKCNSSALSSRRLLPSMSIRPTEKPG